LYLHRQAGVDVIPRRAIDRGELPPDLDFDLVNDLLLGPPFTRAVVRGQPFEPRLADQAADLVLAGIAQAACARSKTAHAAAGTDPSPREDHHPTDYRRRAASRWRSS
jgi:Tetracyclin repressor-like, C-terminal domain